MERWLLRRCCAANGGGNKGDREMAAERERCAAVGGVREIWRDSDRGEEAVLLTEGDRRDRDMV